MLTPGAIVSDLRVAFLIWGANCNNGLHVGAAFNVNNPFSNSNWNIGPSHAYLYTGLLTECLRSTPTPQGVATRLPKGSRENQAGRASGDKGGG